MFSEWIAEQLAIVQSHEDQNPEVLVLTHGDLFADNVIVRPDCTLAVIDWETLSLDRPFLDVGMAVVGLARVGTTLPLDRLHDLVAGYSDARQLTVEQDHLLVEVLHAAIITAYHRYYRHVIRYPDERLQGTYHEIWEFAAGLSTLGPS